MLPATLGHNFNVILYKSHGYIYIYIWVLCPSGHFCSFRTICVRNIHSRMFCLRMSWKVPPLLSHQGQNTWHLYGNVLRHTLKYSAVISNGVYVFHSICREDDPTQPLNACRIHGYLHVNKVAGNFHITVGKYVSFHLVFASTVSWKVCLISDRVYIFSEFSYFRAIPHPRGHAHLAALVSHDSKLQSFFRPNKAMF